MPTARLVLVALSSELLFAHATAYAVVYFLAPHGNNLNCDGTATRSLASFVKAHALLAPGDRIAAGPGIFYTKPIRITKSGAPALPIVVAPAAGAQPVIDMRWRDKPCVHVYGAHVIVEGFELRNTSNMCARLHGMSNVLRRCTAHHAVSHGLFTSGTNTVIAQCSVSLTVLENASRAASWGSALKVGFGARSAFIVSNTVFHNYGEGICLTRAMGATVRHNVVYDNYSVLIYIDNSFDILVEHNHCYSAWNHSFTRNGLPAVGIALGEEHYHGWGAQLRNIRIVNNVVGFTARGLSYFESEVSGGGLSNVTVAYNTFWGSTSTAISIAYEPAKLGGTVIANNLVHQPDGAVAWIDPRSAGKAGLRLFHNFWVGPRPASWRNCTGPGDTNGSPMLAATPVTNDALSLAISLASPAVDNATNIFNVHVDYSGADRAATGGTGHDIGAFEAVPEPFCGAALLSLLAAPVTRSHRPASQSSALPTPSPTPSPLYRQP